MKKNRLVTSIVVITIMSSMFSGCGKASSSKDSSSTVKVDSNAPKFESIVFPDNLPQKPPMAEKGVYGYDNMDKKYSIEILLANYGKPALDPKEDPINLWLSKKFNMDIKLTAINSADIQTTLSTRFASGDEPDITMLPTRELAFTLNEQNLLVDAKTIYPYMPQTNKFTTKNMITWSTASNDKVPFITKYGIQDGVWGFAVRKDWLKKFNMQPPTTEEQLLAYAKACTFNDPDGNGKADTYFMTGAGEGKGWGMLGGFNSMFGNPSAMVADGTLSHPLFNGVEKKYIGFLKELYDAKVLAPDWYTIGWEKAKSYSMNDKLGMVWYPAGALYDEYTQAKNKDAKSVDIWEFYKDAPIENGKYGAAGNPGFLWGFSAKKFTDGGKLMRVAHMLDTMVIGGENYFQTIQQSVNEVYEAAGVKCETTRQAVYNDDGTFYLKNENKFPYASGGKYDPLGVWQQFGLCVSWQMAPPSDDPFDGPLGKVKNEGSKMINSYDRWPNDTLKITLGTDASTAQTSLVDYVNAEELSFVTGKKNLNDWDKYTKEWLSKGGKKIIADTAKSMKVPTPDYAK